MTCTGILYSRSMSEEEFEKLGIREKFISLGYFSEEKQDNNQFCYPYYLFKKAGFNENLIGNFAVLQNMLFQLIEKNKAGTIYVVKINKRKSRYDLLYSTFEILVSSDVFMQVFSNIKEIIPDFDLSKAKKL